MSLTTLAIVALVFLLAAYLWRRTTRAAETVTGTKVLVCSLGAETPEGFEEDAKVYAAH